MSNCNFSNSRNATVGYFKTNNIINNEHFIIDGKKFNHAKANLQKYAQDFYDISDRLMDTETIDGKDRVLFNDVAFRKIDEYHKIKTKISFSIPDEDFDNMYISEDFDDQDADFNESFDGDFEGDVRNYSKIITVIERRKNKLINQVSHIKQKVDNETNVDDKRRMLQDIIVIEKKIEFDEQLLSHIKENKGLDVATFKEKVFDPDIKRLEDILSKDEVSTSELSYIAETIDMWKYVSDINSLEKIGIVNTQEVEEDGYMIELLTSNLAKMKRIERLFNKKIEQQLLKWGSEVGDKKVTKEQMFKSLKDAGVIQANTLNISDFGDNLLDLLYVEMKKREVQQNKKILDLFAKIDEAKKGLTAEQLDLLNQRDEFGGLTGNLVFPYSQSFFSKKQQMWNEYHYLKNHAGVTEAGKYYHKELKKWIKDNHVGFDVQKLFVENDENYKQSLIDELGQERFDKYYEQSLQKWESYQLNLESLRTTNNQESITLFELNNSPISHHDSLFGNGNGKFNSNYYVYVPKVTHLDSAYVKITKDEKLKAYYDLIINITSNYQKVLPHHLRKEFQVNSISFIKKGLVKDIVTNPLGFIQTSLSKIAESISSNKDTNIPANIITGKEIPTVQIHLSSGKDIINKRYNSFLLNFMEDVSNAKNVSDLYSAYPILRGRNIKFKNVKNLWSSNQKQIPDYIKTFLKSKATDEIVTQERETDISVLLKNYILGIESYNAKKASEDIFKLVSIAFENKKELSHGVEKEGLENLKKLLEHQTKLFFQISTDKDKARTRTEKKVYTRDEKETIKNLKEVKEKINNNPNLTEEGKKERVKKIDDQIDSMGSFVTISKFGDALLQYVTHLGLGWSITSGLGNMAFGYVSNYTEAAGQKNFNEKQLNKGYLIASPSSNFTDNGKKLGYVFQKYNFLKTATQELFKRSIDTTKGYKKYIEPMYLQEATEYVNQAPVVYAWMSNQKLSDWTKDPSDADKTLWDNFDKDGNMIKDINEGLMKAKLDQLLNKLHGDYDTITKAMVKNTFLGKATMQFRTWMAKAIDQRFSRYQEATSVNDESKGRWRSYSELFGENKAEKIFVSLQYLLRKMYIGKFLSDRTNEVFSELDAYNMRQNLAELAMLIKTIMAGIIIRGILLDDDDDEDMIKYSSLLALNILGRINTDIVFYVNPIEFEKLNKNFLPLTRIIQDAKRAVDFGARTIFEDEKYDENLEKTLRYVGKLTPGVASSIRLYDYVTNDYSAK